MDDSLHTDLVGLALGICSLGVGLYQLRYPLKSPKPHRKAFGVGLAAAGVLIVGVLVWARWFHGTSRDRATELSEALQVESYLYLASTPDFNTEFTCGGRVCRIDFRPSFRIFNKADKDILIDDLWLEIPNRYGSMLSDAQPRIESAPTVDTFREEAKLKQQIQELYFPLHVAPHSELSVRTSLGLRCYKGGVRDDAAMVTFANNEAMYDLIPVLFGLPQDIKEQSVKYILHMMVDNLDMQMSSEQGVLFVGMKLYLPERSGVSRTRSR